MCLKHLDGFGRASFPVNLEGIPLAAAKTGWFSLILIFFIGKPFSGEGFLGFSSLMLLKLN